MRAATIPTSDRLRRGVGHVHRFSFRPSTAWPSPCAPAETARQSCGSIVPCLEEASMPARRRIWTTPAPASRTRIVVAGLVSAAFCAVATSTLAYRPFNGTDAAVADPGQLEIELQPVGRLQEG